MSFDFRTVRQPSNDPVLKYITNLQKQMVKFMTKDQVDQLESSEDIFADIQDTDSAVKFNTDLNYTHTFRFDKDYYSPVEPDYNKLRVWLQGRSMIKLRDYSEEGNDISLFGDPIIVNGNPFDYGLYDESVIKSIALRFNRASSEHDEYAVIPHTTRTRASEDLSTGISFFVRFRIFDIDTDDDGFDRVLYEKFDNTGITDGALIEVNSEGRVKFHLKNSNVEYNKQTPIDIIDTDDSDIYDVWCIYKKSDNSQKIYINNVDQTLTAADSPVWHANTTNLDATVMSMGSGTAAGNVFGDLYDYKQYREQVVTTAQVGYHWNNKLSISNIPFGQVMVSNHFATKKLSTASYESASYESASYDT